MFLAVTKGVNMFAVVTFADIRQLLTSRVAGCHFMAEVTLLSTGCSPEGHQWVSDGCFL